MSGFEWKNLGLLPKNAFGRSVKNAINVPRRTILRKRTFSEIVFHYSSSSEQEPKFFDPTRKKLQQGCQNCFLRVQRNISRKISFLKLFFFFIKSRFWAEVFRPFAEKFRHGCQNCILSVQRNVFRNIIFTGKLIFFIVFCNWEKRFWPFGEKFQKGWLKLPATSPDENMVENIYFQKISS